MKQIFALEHGFVIAVVMAYLAFLSLTLTLNTKKIHTERLRLRSIQHQRLNLQFGEQKLLECQQFISPNLPNRSMPTPCCLIEKIPQEAKKIPEKYYFRLSTYTTIIPAQTIKPTSKDSYPVAQSRLQASYESTPTDPNLAQTSWREVFDLSFENTLDPQLSSIWNEMNACSMQLPNSGSISGTIPSTLP
jgi:hypothetical protein